MSFHDRACLATSILSLLTASARADVIVVDAQGGNGGPLLQAALDAAQDGDVLLIKPGEYLLANGAMHFDSKGLTLVADAGLGSVQIESLDCIDVPAGSAVTLRGLRIAPGLPEPQPHANSIVGCAAVWMEDCELLMAYPQNPYAFPTNEGAVALSLAGCETVVISRCWLRGGDGQDGTPQGATGGAMAFSDFNSQVLVTDSLVEGGEGGDGLGVFETPGGPALVAHGGALSIVASTLHGGDEGLENPPETQPGSGLVAGVCVVDRRDSAILAGDVIGGGTPSPDVFLASSTLTTYPAYARRFQLPAPLREGRVGVASIRGLTGDAIWISLGALPGFVSQPKHQGVFALDKANLLAPLFVGVITDPGGVLDIPFVTPFMPPGSPNGVVLYAQAWTVDAASQVSLGGQSTFIWLDDAL